MYLVNIDKRGKIESGEDGIYAVPDFVRLVEELGERALVWVALVHDYDSPYRHFSLSDRKRAVSRDLFDTVKWNGERKETTKNAEEVYNSMQFDPLDAQLIAFNTKIDEYTSLMRNTPINDDNAESMQKLMIGIEKVLKTRQTLLDAIERRGKREKIAGDAGKSYLEKKLDYKQKMFE
tara:strand:+ start:481 stop:1014 length:534 start_codon:yes stop_codon:yes gene_type:complete